jgi:hypothetical protein
LRKAVAVNPEGDKDSQWLVMPMLDLFPIKTI